MRNRWFVKLMANLQDRLLCCHNQHRRSLIDMVVQRQMLGQQPWPAAFERVVFAQASQKAGLGA
jgi:hypothetical protein